MLGFQRKREQHIAGLRHNADITRLDVIQRQQVNLVVQVKHARSVWADDTHAVGTGDLHHLCLQRCPLFAGFAKPASQNDRPFHPPAATLGNQRRHAGGRRA